MLKIYHKTTIIYTKISQLSIPIGNLRLNKLLNKSLTFNFSSLSTHKLKTSSSQILNYKINNFSKNINSKICCHCDLLVRSSEVKRNQFNSRWFECVNIFNKIELIVSTMWHCDADDISIIKLEFIMIIFVMLSLKFGDFDHRFMNLKEFQ
jgi:hypothetical protein